MALLFALIFWITITGANIPSGWLADLLIGRLYPWLQNRARPGLLAEGVGGRDVPGHRLGDRRALADRSSSLFTLLDFGYLPRVAFNLDNLFKKAGAHGKQSLSMMMGFGCNAAGMVATRIIDSPRERFIAMLTNNFALCNGRWPTQILIATIFIGTLVPPYLGGLISALAVVGIALLGVLLTFLVRSCPAGAPPVPHSA
jgi:ferrous iron transport protein B